MAAPSSSVTSVACTHFSRARESSILSPLPSRRLLGLAARSSRSLGSFRFRSRDRFGIGAEDMTPRLAVSCSGESKAAAVTKDSWEKSILKSKVPVLVEFYASWCGPCKMVHRVIDEIAEEYAGKVECFVVNADTEKQVADDYDIKAVPVVLLFKNGEKRDTVVGTMPKDFYVAAIERVLKL